MKNYIIKLENFALEMETLNTKCTKEDNIYIFYQENSTISINTHLVLLNLSNKTNVHYCDAMGKEEFLMSVGMIIANCNNNAEIYLGVGVNVEIPSFLKGQKNITINKQTSEKKETNKTKDKVASDSKNEKVTPVSKRRGRPKKEANNTSKNETKTKKENKSTKKEEVIVEKVSKKRGRPKKNTSNKETSNVDKIASDKKNDIVIPVAKKRGRPRKDANNTNQ